MGGIVDTVTSAVGGLLPGFNKKQSDRAEGAARNAAEAQLMAQREALDYLKEREALPQQFREGALSQLGGLAGLEGGDSGAAASLRQSPLYQATVGQLPQQEEAILRSQSATGALRSSGTEQMLANNQRMNQLQAYQNAMQPLQGLAGLQSYAPQIAQGIQGMGQTQAQGIIGAEQSRQAAQQAGFGNLMGLGQLGLSAFSAFCDPALKDDVQKVGELEGFSIYRWTWNDKAADLGLYGEGVGPMADEIEAFYPERIEVRNGYKFVRAANGY